MFSKTKIVPVIFGLLALSLVPQFALAHGMSEADKLAIIEGGNLRYMWLGATHMLSGYDHLLFVFGIIFFLTSFRDIAKYVTAFTVGHSVTLIYATFNGIQLNYFLIDAVIGLSVIYIAFANIDGFRKYLGVNPPNMMMMIIGLGLIHGFGLSTRLQELPLSEDELLLNIISFNVGIELGQITALAAMLVLIAAWRKRDSFRPFSLAANYGLVAAGALLFLMQMHGYSHTSNPEEFAVAAKPTKGVISSAIAKPSTLTPEPSRQDTFSIRIPPRGEKEFKLLMAEGTSMEYAWQTDGGELFYDLHGEPQGDQTGYFETFKKDTSKADQGVVSAPFAGTHGWYWKSNSSSPVMIELTVKGAYQQVDGSKATPVADAKPSTRKKRDSID
ncbi:MAG: HupE/UreJ family protein [Chromatiales bacterium]|nr:HupE/UreJ family protein [Chromatiales bacterium]